MRKSAVLLSLLFVGCGLISRDGASFSVVGDRFRPLSSDFNADVDNVRIVMLASPT